VSGFNYWWNRIPVVANCVRSFEYQLENNRTRTACTHRPLSQQDFSSTPCTFEYAVHNYKMLPWYCCFVGLVPPLLNEYTMYLIDPSRSYLTYYSSLYTNKTYNLRRTKLCENFLSLNEEVRACLVRKSREYFQKQEKLLVLYFGATIQMLHVTEI
jgi:hypothetical protein